MILCLTTAHPPNDGRIYLRQLKSLKKLNQKIVYLATYNMSDKALDDDHIEFISLAKRRGRLHRYFVLPFKVIFKVLLLRPKLIHFHDPENLLLVPFFKLLNILVIYDVHEDYVSSIKEDREYIPKPLRNLVSTIFSFFEQKLSLMCDAVIVATPMIKSFFPSHHNLEIVANFCAKEDLFEKRDSFVRRHEFIYIGNISKHRGIFEICKAANIAKGNFVVNIIGSVNDKLLKEIKLLDTGNKLNFFGHKDRSEIKDAARNSIAGISILHPLKNYHVSYPTKLFEYFALGMPCICSDFELWKEFIGYGERGIAVNPYDYKALAHALDFYFDNQEIAHKHGKSAQKSFLEAFNWEGEEVKLLDVYKKLNI